MSDLISRQAAIKAIDDLPNCYNGYSNTYDKAYIIGVLEELPSVDVPDRKVGKWETEVRTIHGHKIPFFACSVCGRNADDEYTYCPNCGAKMGDDWEEPEINPCRGCDDYDGHGGCKSHGGCGAERSEDERTD